MSQLMKLIQEADVAAVEFEKARSQVESAKQSLQSAKEIQEQAQATLDEIINRSDEVGIPRAKLKKLIEERTQSLVASGLIPTTAEVSMTAISKNPKPRKKIKVASDAEGAEFMPSTETDLQPLELN